MRRRFFFDYFVEMDMDRDCLLTIRVRVDNMLQHDPHLLVPVSEVGGPGAVARGGLVARAGGRVAAARARRRVGRVRAGVAVPVGRPGELVMITISCMFWFIVVLLYHKDTTHPVIASITSKTVSPKNSFSNTAQKIVSVLATILQGFCINIYKVDIRCCSVQLCNIHMMCPLQISSVHVSIIVHSCHRKPRVLVH